MTDKAELLRRYVQRESDYCERLFDAAVRQAETGNHEQSEAYAERLDAHWPLVLSGIEALEGMECGM